MTLGVRFRSVRQIPARDRGRRDASAADIEPFPSEVNRIDVPDVHSIPSRDDGLGFLHVHAGDHRVLVAPSADVNMPMIIRLDVGRVQLNQGRLPDLETLVVDL